MKQRYEILVHGQVKRNWQDWFSGMSFVYLGNQTMMIVGELADQTSLLGILATIDELGMTIMSVNLRILDMSTASQIC